MKNNKMGTICDDLIAEVQFRNYKDSNEFAMDCEKRIQNNDMDDFYLHESCKLVLSTIDSVLNDFAQCSKNVYLIRNLKDRFPGLTKEALENCNEFKAAEPLVGENRSQFYLIKDPLATRKLIETVRYQEFSKKYKKHPDILNLKDIWSNLYQIVMEDDIQFSKEEVINVLYRALHAKHPQGPVFDLNTDLTGKC